MSQISGYYEEGSRCTVSPDCRKTSSTLPDFDSKSWPAPARFPVPESGVSIDGKANGDIYVSGNFRDTVDFDPGVGIENRTAVGVFDGFVLKLSDTPPSNVNEAPTDIVLDSTDVDENAAVGTTVGTFSTTDADASDTHTYTLVAGSGDADNARFSIGGTGGDELLTAETFDFESQGPINVRVRTTDSGGLSFEESVAITVTDVNEAPTVANPVADVTANEDDPDDLIDLSSTFADVDAGDTQLLTVTGNTNPSLVSASIVDTTLTLDYLADQNGTADITVRVTDSGGLFVEDTFTVSVLSAADQISNVNDEIQALVDAEDLAANEANPLAVKLDKGLDKLDRDQTNAAINQLNAFINQINVYVNTGKLTQQQGDQVIDLVQAAIDSATEGGGATLLSDGTGGVPNADKPIDSEHELLIGIVGVSLTHASGNVTTDQYDRLDDTLAALNSTFDAYGVTLVAQQGNYTTDVDLYVEIAAISECGGAAEGILGCTAVAGEITIIDGWSWYSGADSSAIGAGQFDFQTVLTHELGHALGLDHSGDAISVMYGWLATSDSRRGLTSQDLELLGAGGDGGALRAAPATDLDANNHNESVLTTALANARPADRVRSGVSLAERRLLTTQNQGNAGYPDLLTPAGGVQAIDLLLATNSMAPSHVHYGDEDSTENGDGEIDSFEVTLSVLASDVFNAIGTR